MAMWFRSHDQNGCRAHTTKVKTFKNVPLQNQRFNTPGLWYVALRI